MADEVNPVPEDDRFSTRLSTQTAARVISQAVEGTIGLKGLISRWWTAMENPTPEVRGMAYLQCMVCEELWKSRLLCKQRRLRAQSWSNRLLLNRRTIIVSGLIVRLDRL